MHKLYTGYVRKNFVQPLNRLASLPQREAMNIEDITDVLKGFTQPKTFDLLCSEVIAARVVRRRSAACTIAGARENWALVESGAGAGL
jgi:hypothetical protein